MRRTPLPYPPASRRPGSTLPRQLASAALLLAGACGGGARPVTTPRPAPAAAPAPTAAPTGGAQPLPPPPQVVEDVPGPMLPASEELALLVRQSADSAKDAELLQRLSTDTAAATRFPDTAAPVASPLAGGAVTWDIDVDTYADHRRVQYWLDFFQGFARDRFAVWLERLARYEPMVRERLQAEGLPSDLVYLALIESGFSNSAVSRSRAVGMWQFMRGTARDYGLHIDRWVDERRDPVKATDAAAKHLSMLYRRFGSLYLTAAAYNAGGGKISRTLNRLDIEPEEDEDGESGFTDAHFFRLYDTRFIRQETKDYVPKLIAAALIAKEPAKYGFTVPAGIAPYDADSIVIPEMTGFDVIARIADTSVAAIRELNPQFLRMSTPPGRTVVVRLPHGHGERAAAAYAALPASERLTFATHVARKGETLARIAQQFGLAASLLRDANPGLPAGRLAPGTRVLVPQGGELSVAVTRDLAAASTAQFHKVRSGETLGRIARRYGVTVGELRQWNRLGRKVSRVRAGTRLRVSEPEEGALPARTAHPAPAKRAEATRAPAARTVAKRHVVKRGETLAGLARRYGVRIRDIQEANHLGERQTLRAGERLKIPA